MGEVGIIYRILPKDLEIDVNDLSKRIEENIKGICNIKGVQIKPIAFGLQAILMFISIKDEEKASEAVEQKIREVDGVGEIDIEEMSLL